MNTFIFGTLYFDGHIYYFYLGALDLECRTFTSNSILHCSITTFTSVSDLNTTCHLHMQFAVLSLLFILVYENENLA